MDDNKLTLILEDGTETICDIILTHKHENKTYVIFEFSDTKEISAAEYIEDLNDRSKGTFKDIEDDKIWDVLDQVLDKYYENLEEEA